MDEHAVLPPLEVMDRAFRERDPGFDGVFYAAVTTTRIFCRPSCPARKPGEGRVEFYATPREALFAGFRPCLRCRPLEAGGRAPDWVRGLLDAVEADPERRFRDGDLRELGVDPVAARRWFKRSYGMTFQSYNRARRLGRAFDSLKRGASVDDAALGHGWESFSGFREAFGKTFGSPPGALTARAPGNPDAVSARNQAGPGAVGSPGPDFIRLGWIETPLGPMAAGAVEDGLCLLEFTDRRMLEAQLETLRSRFRLPLSPADSPHFRRLRSELSSYFAGLLRDFTVPVVLRGTDFQERVWRGLLGIPYGTTISYAALAGRIGAPGASRAVGHANGLNRIAVLVPCHRVVNADGQIGGYGGGLWRKKALLDLERGLRRFE